MSGGGGKGGSKTQETTIPAWIRDPAIRNLQRAEDVQRIEYMPYYGAEVAAFNPMQNAAMNNNIATAQAFGLLDPNSTLTATTGMPTPTDFDGFSGYSSQPMYESALAELKAKQPDAVAQYDALFGANVPTTRSTGQGGFRGSANVSFGGGRPRDTFTPNYNDPHFKSKTHLDEINATGGGSSTSILDASYGGVTPTMDYSSIKNQLAQEKAAGVGNYATKTPSYSSRLDSKGYTPMGK